MISGLDYFRELNIASVLLRLVLAMAFGGMIGLERGRKHRAAGFRTYMLVCLGSALTSILSQSDSIQFYTTKCFDNGYSTRKVLDFNLSDKAAADKQEIDQAVAAGAARADAVAPYVTDEAFEAWYQSFCQALEKAAHA